MEDNNHKHSWCCGCGNSFWGWFFVIIGVYFLAQELDWIPGSFPLWQILLMVFGIYLIVGKRK